MNLAYLMNSYPLISTTFIRREIEAIERTGQKVERFAVRGSPVTLVDPLDVAEIHRTHYLLDGNLGGLLRAFFREFFTNFGAFIKSFAATLGLWRKARRAFIPHMAYFLQAIYFKQQAQKHRLDHVHVHFSTNATSVAMLSRILGGPSYSFTVHGPDELSDPTQLGLADKVRGAKFVVAITDFCQSQIIRFTGIFASEKTHVMRCGLELADFMAAPPASQENQHFVCLGRLCPQKAQTMLPPIAARLRGEFPNLRFTLIGDGESRKDVEQEIERYNVKDMFNLTGSMENVLAREHIRKSRALLLPSFAEGLPIVIMEAMAVAKPAISTYVAGIPELLDETCGWIIPPSNEKKLEEAIRSALQTSPEKLQAKGAEGRRRVFAHHNIDDLASHLLSQFKMGTDDDHQLSKQRL